MKTRDDRWPFIVGQMLGLISFEDKKEELEEILGSDGAGMFNDMLHQIATTFYDQGEKARGLIRRREAKE